jgi:hypothetical protein
MLPPMRRFTVVMKLPSSLARKKAARASIRATDVAERDGMRVRLLEDVEVDAPDAELLDDQRNCAPAADHFHADAAFLQLDWPTACEAWSPPLRICGRIFVTSKNTLRVFVANCVSYLCGSTGARSSPCPRSPCRC